MSFGALSTYSPGSFSTSSSHPRHTQTLLISFRLYKLQPTVKLLALHIEENFGFTIFLQFLLRMRSPLPYSRWIVGIPLLAVLILTVSANDVLKTTGFTTCMADSDITVTALSIEYDRTTQQITFDVAGTSSKVENVTAALYVTAYGKQVYQKTFNPCDDSSKVDQLCPGESETCLLSLLWH